MLFTMKKHSSSTLVCVLSLITHVLGQMRGVNLGGWLTTEQWIAPSVYENTTAPDEWHLCAQLGKEACLTTLQAHWSTFYTRDDLVEIANAGLNTLRIPLGYWAVELEDYEPYVSGQYPYLIQAVQWSQELGLSVMIVLHGVPGSQNGYAGSGLIGPILFPSNTSNLDRSLNVLKNLTQEFSQGIYGDTVTSIELLNEPNVYTTAFTVTQLQSFYTEGISTVNGIDANLNVTLGDGWFGSAYWTDYYDSHSTGTVHLTIDTHNFYAFTPNIALDRDGIINDICNLSQKLKQSSASSNIPPTVIGEWSLQSGVTTQSTASQAWREWLRLLFEAQIAAYTPTGPGQSILGWIFWTWKTEQDINTWSYRRGIGEGYIPADVSNASDFVYPLLSNGCVNSDYTYTAPAYVTPFVGPNFASSTASGAKATSTASAGTESKPKSSAPSLGRLGVRSWALISAAWALAWWVT